MSEGSGDAWKPARGVRRAHTETGSPFPGPVTSRAAFTPVGVLPVDLSGKCQSRAPLVKRSNSRRGRIVIGKVGRHLTIPPQRSLLAPYYDKRQWHDLGGWLSPTQKKAACPAPGVTTRPSQTFPCWHRPRKGR